MQNRLFLTLALSCALFTPLSAGEAGDAFIDAARDGDLATVKRLLGEGADVNATTKYGATALAYAADKGHVEIVRLLLDRGADVNVTDTFYNATPVTWAAMSEHSEIIGMLLEKGATGADQILSQGVGAGDKVMVEAALKGTDLSPGALSQALTTAKALEDGAAIVALLEAVEIEIPEVEQIAVEPSVLETYVGKFKNDEIGLGLDVRLEDGNLILQATGQGPLTLRALSQTRFEAIEFTQVQIEFAGRGGLIEQAIIHQAGQVLPFPRVVETTEAVTEAEAQPQAEIETAKAEIAPAPVERQAPQNWPSFRGPGASGVADGQGAPLEWNIASGKNVLWKTPIPGLANSSPIIWGDRVFVTTAISAADDDTFRTGLYGDVDSVEDVSEHTFKVYALDRESGKVVWEKTAGVSVPGAKRHLKSTQANSTPVTDGKRVVALFGTIGVLVAYDMDGKQSWKSDIGVLDAGWFYDKTYQWGHASSPVIYDDFVIVQADIYEGSFIAAYNLKNGKLEWKTTRADIPSWGTPTIYRSENRDELVTNGTTIRGYDPKTGQELWTLAPNSEVTVATPVIAHDLAFVTAGYPPVRPIYAIRLGDDGDLSLPEDADSSEAVAWSVDRGGTYMPTPIVYGDYLYTCANDGRLTAYEAKTGERVYRQRVGAGTHTASPIAADGKLYFTTEEGSVVVARAGAEYEELARNEMDEVCMSTPAISDGVLIVRTQKHVYGLGEKTVEAGGAQ
jgi:outer membrane protein assembly factor BamB